MKIKSSRLGEIEVDEENIVIFANGIPGFEYTQQYVFIHPEPESPMTIMQSIEDENAGFIVADPFLFYANYEFQIPENVQKELGIQKENEVAVWCVVSVPEQVQDATVNLFAPIVVNTICRKGKQIILHGSDYSIRQQLFVHPSERASQTK